MYKLDCHQFLDKCCNGSIRVSQNSVHLHQSVQRSFISMDMKILYLYLFIVLLYIVIKELHFITPVFYTTFCYDKENTPPLCINYSSIPTFPPSSCSFSHSSYKEKYFPMLLQVISQWFHPSRQHYLILLCFFFDSTVFFVSIMSYPFMTFYWNNFKTYKNIFLYLDVNFTSVFVFYNYRFQIYSLYFHS